MTSFETLLTSCDSQIIRLLRFKTYSMRNKGTLVKGSEAKAKKLRKIKLKKAEKKLN